MRLYEISLLDNVSEQQRKLRRNVEAQKGLSDGEYLRQIKKLETLHRASLRIYADALAELEAMP